MNKFKEETMPFTKCESEGERMINKECQGQSEREI